MNLKCQTFLIKYVRINLYNSIPYKLEFTAIQCTKIDYCSYLLLSFALVIKYVRLRKCEDKVAGN